MDKVKAIFRAQYLYQHVYADDLHKERCELKYVSGADDGCYLLLRSIKDLTDGEVREIANLNDLYNNGFKRLNDSIVVGNKFSEMTIYFRGHIWKPNCQFLYETYQYLLRIGILLPFCYLDENNNPITLQPDEIIQLGWVKYIN